MKKKTVKKQKKQKSAKKKIIILTVATAVITVIILSIVFFSSHDDGSFNYESFKAASETKAFLDDLMEEDYASAAEYIYFFDSEEDVSAGTTADITEAKDHWISRVKTQKEDTYANYITDYSDVKTYKKDGKLFADVKLQLRLRGVLTYQTETFQFQDGKIYSITKYPIDSMDAYEYALSGYMESDE